jgi:plasmid maintenance system antidote protein VapI
LQAIERVDGRIIHNNLSTIDNAKALNMLKRYKNGAPTMKAYEWINRVKREKRVPSDYAVAKLLGVTQSAISVLRTRESTMSDETSVKVALALGIAPITVLIDQQQEKTTNECAKEAWERLGRVIDFRHDTLVI